MKWVFSYDLKTNALVSVTYGVVVFPLSFLTIFYYMVLFLISNWLFGGMNFYFQGILAGGTGGIWSYFVSKAIDKHKEISFEISSYSNEKYLALLKKRSIVTLGFFILTCLEIIIIKFEHLY